MSDFNEKLAENAADIELALDTLLTAPRLAGPGEPPDRLIAAMRHGTLNGGKRLRPFLLRETAAIFGVAPELSLTAATAIELVHCYSLIHDDLPAMDDDDVRRGRPTVHKAYDDATAILAGDALLTLAFGHLAEHGAADPTLRARLVVELAAGAGTGGMVGGQMADIAGEHAVLDDIAIARMQAMKTGALIRAAIRIGALLGNADTEALGHLTAYADTAGRAFQLADDLLDVTASPAALGKATQKDADRNKQTLVSKIGLDAARRHLGNLVHDAITALTPFGPEADTLRETARYFATPGKLMSLASVTADLDRRAPDLDIIFTTEATNTVERAALVHGVAPGQIAKTLAIRVNGEDVLLVTRGDARLHNQKARAALGGRPRMLGPDDVLRLTSHEVGGVCPFGLPGPLPIYCDISLKIYDEIIPAAGSTHTSIRLPLARLVDLCGGKWVDACEIPAPLNEPGH